VINDDVNDGYDEDGSGDHDNDGDDEYDGDLALQHHQVTLSTLLYLSSTYHHRPIIIYQSSSTNHL
jgi:hypothetical protein